jgi:hypothetical protein
MRAERKQRPAAQPTTNPPYELHELSVQVDQQLAAVGLAHEQRRVQADALLLDALEPRLVPHLFKLHQRLGHL